MVAALYGHPSHLEIALALPEDYDSNLLVDASHLTWRTLPVAAVVRDKADLLSLAPLVEEAARRVARQEHDVMRDNDFFMKARAARSD